MNPIFILAQTTESATRAYQAGEEAFMPIEVVWEHIISLNILEAITFISFGAICLFYGWRVFKLLVVISFGLLGLMGGMMVSKALVASINPVWAGFIGLVVFAVLSVPLMRYAVSVLGAIAGGTVAAGVWYALGLSETYIWAGALVGIVAGGMISFIIFRVAVMLFSSLGGSGLLVTGLLALLYMYPQTTTNVQEMFFMHKWFLPLVITLPTAAGIFIQNKFIKESRDWSV